MIDGFHAHGSNLYSVFERSYHDGQVDAGHYIQGLLSSEMKLKFPEVKYATGIAAPDEFNTFEASKKILKEHGGMLAMLIALIAASFQTIKASLANQVT